MPERFIERVITMIKIKNLSKIYKNGKYKFYALNNISLNIKCGEFLMITGRSGCGKSSLLNIIGLIDDFDSGDYFLYGQNIKQLNKKQLAKTRLNQIGYIYQSFNLINELNCLDNIQLIQGYAGISKLERQKNAKSLISRVGLSKKANSYPSELSGGEQQRIAIARAIPNNPKIILADEPTGNLDYNTGLEIMSLLKELNKQGITIIMVTHDRDLLSYSSRFLVMQDGIFIN